jgi:hypothetical protein
MPQTARQVEDCSYRLPLAEGETEIACCGLLEQITGVVDTSLCRVRRDACLACCGSFHPNAVEINPIIASLLYGLSTEIMRRGGVEGCDRRKAELVNRFAAEYVPSEADCVDTPAGTEIPSSSATLDQIIPAPARRSGHRVRRWAVGVTTAPRPVPTLERCLASLAEAGWDRPRLFSDGEVEIPSRFVSLPRTDRIPQLGAWPSYYLALAELLMREPEADAFLMVQDDVLFADFDVRAYLEGVLWPGKAPWTVSLFCPRPYTRPEAGWHPFEDHWIWGAQAFVFSREAAQCFLADLQVVRHRWNRVRNPLADIDWCVGQWASTRKRPIYYPTPSLVQHMGELSSLWKGQRVWGYRRASWFAQKSR